MVTYKTDNQTVAVPKMKSNKDSNSSELRLMENEHQETSSSISRNSVYKLKIDLMFDDTNKSIRRNRLDDPRGSHRTRSIIMYGRSELAGAGGAESSRSIAGYLQETNEGANLLADNAKKDVQRISNSVQAQIEQLFSDVAKDASNTFPVSCLGSLPLKEKINSLQGLQQPLRELYLRERDEGEMDSGILEICSNGLQMKIVSSGSGSCNDIENRITPFRNIAVWSAVKFILSPEEGGAAFLPLITSPENIDKKQLFQPLSLLEKKRLSSESPHAPIFAVVMRSANVPKTLECHAFICKSTEDAIIIAATLYQSLMSHVSFNTQRNTKRRPPHNQNGVSCMSITSSSALTSPNYHLRPQLVTTSPKNSLRGSLKALSASSATRSERKKRVTNVPLSIGGNIINETAETSSEERKGKSHKTKRAPPIPKSTPEESLRKINSSNGHNKNPLTNHFNFGKHSQRTKQSKSEYIYKGLQSIAFDMISPLPMISTVGSSMSAGLSATDNNGDILTRVAIPRSGSFLNTAGLTRYKSRAVRRYPSKLGSSLNGGGGGGGGGSPLGFSELFNEFRLHENLHSMDEILYAIINTDGMSFNDLKPIYKEFLLKLAVTLTKDELFQRSKNIMRRQKKKKRKTNPNSTQRKTKTAFFCTKNLKKVFRLDQFRSCREKISKTPNMEEQFNQRKSEAPLIMGPSAKTTKSHNSYSKNEKTRNQQHDQNSHHLMTRHNRLATSGSDVSVIRNENILHGLNRNSSSGYVSCSECSYDSEACTCSSADRCYCSLRARKSSNHVKRKNDRKHFRKTKIDNKHNNRKSEDNSGNKRNSYVSCKSDEKCYCSMVEEEDRNFSDKEGLYSGNNNSETTWCDTDSCKSASKCYCKKLGKTSDKEKEGQSPQRKEKSSKRTFNKVSDKLALDYELFNINNKNKTVQPHEALSVKKSVEAAAIFADVKLSQTTDITNLAVINSKDIGTCRSYSISARRQSCAHRKRETYSIDRHNEHNLTVHSLTSLHKASSTDDLLTKLSYIEKNIVRAASVHSGRAKTGEIILHEKFQNNYQSMRAISASLEDALGYLP